MLPGLLLFRELVSYAFPFLGKRASLVAQTVKNLPAMQEPLGSIPWLGRSPGEGNGCPLQYSCLENSMDRGAWRVKSGTQLTLSLSLLSLKPPHAAEEAPWEEGTQIPPESVSPCVQPQRGTLSSWASLLLPALIHQAHSLCGCVCIQARGRTGARPTRLPPGGACLPAGSVRQLLLQTETSLTLCG